MDSARSGDHFQKSSFEKLYQTDVFQQRTVLLKNSQLDPVLVTFTIQIHSSYGLFTAQEAGPAPIDRPAFYRTLQNIYSCQSTTVNQAMLVLLTPALLSAYIPN